MADYPGSNDSKTLAGMEKATYSEKLAYAVPDTKGRFKKLKKVLKDGK